MVFLVLAMLVATGLAVAVVGVVAVPARRNGRDVLTAKGEGVLEAARERVGGVGRSTAARTRTH
ncbi:MAG TPA: hypothetical protein VFJ94_12145 [Intrasporangium sp.]|uniref:hypothetical protein n=1 Tax=Intrasporangium sp. TaxID=1925024 RepID=UPI002D78D722|nr:hypothetical protein [Intrasporangium sp.]HET7399259.1 hypothetical protein [Intrasporangium sp.]